MRSIRATMITAPRRFSLLALLGLAVSLARCTSAGFTCKDDSQCQGAGPAPRCEPDGGCSVDDGTCDSGRRYAALSGPLFGECVAGTAADSTLAGSEATTVVSTSTSIGDDSIGDETTTPRTTGVELLPDLPPEPPAESSSSTGDTGSVPIDEICDGEDNDGDGLVDEHSESNESCNECVLFQFDDFAWWVCPELQSWPQAVEHCVTLGASLAIVDSALQNELVTATAGGQGMWLGASDIAIEGQWRWIDGSDLPSDHPQWGSDQPDNAGPVDVGEDCLTLSSSSLFESGDWNDDFCDDADFGFVCRAPHRP